MNAFSLAFWVTLALVGLALGFHFYFRKKLRYEAQFNLLNNFAMEHGSKISIHDSWVNIHIGMDGQQSNQLFYIRKSAGGEIREVIDLAEIRDCKLNRLDRNGSIERIDLVFTYTAKGKPSLRLEFYNSDYDALTLSGELQLAEKWEEIVRKSIEGIREGAPAGPAGKPIGLLQ